MLLCLTLPAAVRGPCWECPVSGEQSTTCPGSCGQDVAELRCSGRLQSCGPVPSSAPPAGDTAGGRPHPGSALSTSCQASLTHVSALTICPWTSTGIPYILDALGDRQAHSFSGPILVDWGCCNRTPPTARLMWQTFTPLSSGGWEPAITVPAQLDLGESFLLVVLAWSSRGGERKRKQAVLCLFF